MLTLLFSRAGIFTIAGLFICGGVGIGVLAFRHLRTEVATAQAVQAAQARQLDQAQAVNAGNLAAMAEFRADAAKAVAAVAADRDAALRRAASLSHARQEVAHAAIKDRADCPVAASVRAAVDSLRRPAGAAAAPH